MSTNFGNDALTGYVSSDGFTGIPGRPGVTPAFAPALFPYGIGSGTTVGPAGTQGQIEAARKVAIAVTATANTDITASVPPTATVIAIDLYTTTAFGAVTDATIQIGSTAGGVDYVAATSIKAVGLVRLTLVGAAAASLLSMPNASPNLFIRIVQTGGSSATGAATAVVRYLVP